jgi:hypothetical protein
MPVPVSVMEITPHSPRWHALVLGVSTERAGLYDDAPAFGHRVTRVCRKIDEGQLHLRAIDRDRSSGLGQPDLHVDHWTRRIAKQRHRVGQKLV